MSLTTQFIIVSLIPATFLFLAAYLAWVTVNRRQVVVPWLLALLTAAVWSTVLVSYYGGVGMPAAVTFTWRVISNHAFSLLSLWIFIATAAFLSLTVNRLRFTITVVALLWLASLALDEAIWYYVIPDVTLFGQTIRHFDWWAAVWVTTSFLPLVAAWLLTHRACQDVPSSFYRNQLDYWLLALSVFLLAGALAVNRQIVEQQVAVLAVMAGALIGSVAITRAQLPDLQSTLRQLGSRFFGAILIFAFSWLAFWAISQNRVVWPGLDPNLELGVAAAVFVTLFLAIHYLVSRLTRNSAQLSLVNKGEILTEYAGLAGSALPPLISGQLTLKLIQTHLGINEAWIMLAEDGPGGRIILRPLVSLPQEDLESFTFDSESIFIGHLRHNSQPLLQYDLEHWNTFSSLAEADKAILDEWGRVLYMPLHAGTRLIGVLGLGKKFSDEPYHGRDFDLLQGIASQVGPWLAQAQNVAGLHETYQYVAERNWTLVQENRRLQELTSLYHDFVNLISPEMRRPFVAIDREIQRIQEQLAEGRRVSYDGLNQQLSQLKEMIDTLINTSTRMQKHSQFDFQIVRLDEIIRDSQQNLAAMANARRVRMDIHLESSNLPPVYGDERRLREALQYLLHNAIKFNKIGGLVRIECGVSGNEIQLDVMDNGVGISAERMPTLWNAFAGMTEGNAHNAKESGMGLLLTRFIVQAHGGRVDAVSRYGSGSTFSLYFPVVMDVENT